MAAEAPIRVFLVDDDEDDFLIVKSTLAKSRHTTFSLDWTADFTEAKQRIAEGAHDAYLIDYRLGGQSGLDILEWAQPNTMSQPFIILTGAGDERIERQAMKAGASDYLVKGGFDTELLSRTLRYAIQRKRLEAERIQELVDINRAKDEFISLASHQLRTPATAVKQYIGMALEGFLGDLTDTQRSMLEAAYSSNERQIQIVNELLYVAQVDAGKLQLRKETTDLKTLLEDIAKEQGAKLRERAQHITLLADDKAHEAAVDYLHFRMAVDNLIDNASKYSEHGKTITVRLIGNTQIAIEDEGVGIREEDMNKLFQKFSRLYNPMSTAVGGSGLGLYWSNRVLQLHGAELSVTSTEGKGSTFTVTLRNT